jgi:polysaccharide export outer membrane protein
VFTVAQPGANGSYRSISLKRGSNIVATFDLYELLRDGELKNDRKLQPGDVVLVGNAGNRVALNVDGPAAAIFESKENETLQDLVRMAGIDLTLIRQDSVLIEGFKPDNPTAPRAIEQLNFQRAMGDSLRDGDIVTLFPARLAFSNAVTLKGNVADPARYPYYPGMRIADLIPNTEMLIPPSYYQQRGALALDQQMGRQKAFEENRTKRLGDIPEASGTEVDTNSDRSSPSNSTLLREAKIAEQEGRATVEDTVRNLLPQINWEYAVVERLNKQELKPQLIPFNLRKALAKDKIQNLELQPGDVVTIFSADDADIPKANKTALIKISGEVLAPGFYQIQDGETIRDALAKAGGITENAYLFGTKLTRRAIQQQQTEQLKKALDQAERLLQASTTARASSALNAGDAGTAQNVAASQQAYLERLRQVKPDGRVVLEVKPDSNTLAQLPPLELEDGDTINVPAVPGQVAVFGSVFSQGAFAYRNGRTVFDYLGDAGGAAKSSDKGSIFVLRANGTVSSAQQGWVPFVSGLYGKKALPGDAIYVPEDYERTSFLKTMLDVSTVFYQVGLGALAIEAIRD